MSDKTEVTRSSEALTRAFAGHLRTGAALLAAWKAGLAPERLAMLDAFETKGMRIGLSLSIPEDRWIAQVFLLDAAGATTVLDEIQQAGAMPAIN